MTAKPAFFSLWIVGWLVIHRLGVCVSRDIVSGLMGLGHLRDGEVCGGTKRGYGCGSQAAMGRVQPVTP
jgi:hypothetical protein